MTDLESAKARCADACERLVRGFHVQPGPSLLDAWIELLAKTGILSHRFSFNPREMHDYYSPDEAVFSKTFDFYGPAYLRECCSPGPDCLAGKHCIPIGGVDGASEFIYISENLALGIAHLHRDDVFSASDLDAVVTEDASRLNFPLVRFVQHLAPPTNFATLGPPHDASKWLRVEDLGTKVRYEINLSGDWNIGERSFAGPMESEEFFFDLIRQGRAVTDLTIVVCSQHLRRRIETLLEPNEER
jgi:hypothetical protein